MTNEELIKIANDSYITEKAVYFLNCFKRGKRFYNLSKKDQDELDIIIKELNKKV